MIEKWLEIKEWAGYYVSNTGKIKKGDKLITLYPNKSRRNYVYAVYPSRKMRPKNLSVHRLVARYFLANPDNKSQVNHIDFNTQNNSIENLEWCTPKENTRHTINNGRKVVTRGEKSNRKVLTEAIAKQILFLISEKKLTHIQIAKRLNTNYSNVAHIKRGSRWGYLQKLSPTTTSKPH